ncbi:Type I Iterative PKS [Diaporthe australafricana]|uniref:Type I Iterative PKS n=1 Tax=Diaporthe australafricana TaxID=127596 RepID=A0ABR3Y5S3_9PEZI
MRFLDVDARSEDQPDGSTSAGSSWDHVSNSNNEPSDLPSSQAENSQSPVPVAICGMAMRLPGDISSGEQLWDFLVNKRNARGVVPTERYNSAAFHGGPEGRTRHGYFLKDLDIEKFDASLFTMTRAELEWLDPQVRILLELTRECFENAGEVRWRGRKDIGCYIGTWGEDWKELHTKDTQSAEDGYSVTGIMDFQFSNKISHEYDLRGPSFVVKSACSSSLIALHEACRAIQAGDIRGALVGGVNMLLSPTQTAGMYKAGVLSPRDQCRSFDASADGYCRAEGANMIYVKRLDDALRDGNPVRAVVRGTATNADGKGEGLFAPSAEGHEALIRSCYGGAGIEDLGRTAHFECHGTGTRAGDPTETTAVANVFGDHGGISIGSSKPNLGHSEGASGITSVIKSVLALERQTLLPNIQFENPNPSIPWERGLHVPVDATPFPQDRAERISINAFGLGGSNAHVILDSARSLGVGTPLPAAAEETTPRDQQQIAKAESHHQPRLLVYTANNAESAKTGAEQHANFLADTIPRALADAAYTLAVRREHLAWRTFAVADGTPQAAPQFLAPSKLPSGSKQAAPDVVFVFTGQGAQWAKMGSRLLSAYPSAGDDVALMDDALSKLEAGVAPSWTIAEELGKSKQDSQVSKAEFSQPLCTAIQIIITNILRSWGVDPAAVIGHSSGEIAAAYACGALTMQEAIVCAYLRGLATKEQQGGAAAAPGAMAAVGLGAEEVKPLLPEGVVVACENSPSSTTLSGDAEGIDGVIGMLKDDASGREIFARRLHVDKAYHSPKKNEKLESLLTDEYLHIVDHMKEPGVLYERLLAPHISSKAASIPFYSTVTNEVVHNKGCLSPSYWRSNMERPVLFNTTMQKLLEDRKSSSAGNCILLEIGPHSALAGPIRQILKAAQTSPATTTTTTYLSTLARDSDEAVYMLSAAGQLFVNGADIRFDVINPSGRVRTDLPRYPWHRDARYWHESRLSSEWRKRRFPHHEFLGSRVHECGDLEPVWRNVLKLGDVPWCRDHVIARDIVLPATAYLVMICEAIRQLTGAEEYSLRQVTISAACILHESQPTELVLAMKPVRVTSSLASPSWYDFTITSLSSSSSSSTSTSNRSAWTKHCAGQVRAGADEGTRPEQHRTIADLPRKVNMTACYAAVRETGLKYGPTFQRLGGVSAYPGTKKDGRIVRRLVNEVPGVLEKQQQQQSTTDNDEDDDKGRPWHYHPVTLDFCFQLFQLASMHGLARNCRAMTVPTYLDAMYIRRPPPRDAQLTAEATARLDFAGGGGVLGDCVGVAGSGEVVMRLRGCRMTSLDDNGDFKAGDQEDPHAAARVVWRPDLDFQSISGLVSSTGSANRRPTEALQRLTLLCCVDALERLGHVERASSVPEHLIKLLAWLTDRVRLAQAGQYPFVSDAAALVMLPAGERGALLDSLTTHLQEKSSVGVVATALRRVLGSVQGIFSGETSALDVLRQDDILTRVYNLGHGRWDFSRFLRLLGHRRPHLRVLEVGAGTGGTTGLVLKGLMSEKEGGGDRMFGSYVFTDVSSGFFGPARERFGHVPGMEFLALDISRDPGEQGFALGSFDLIVAANVLHATPSLSQTLNNVRRLLRPDGKLLLQEMWTESKAMNLVMGTLPGWWLGSEDGRAQEPYVHPDRWALELTKAGFSSPDAVVPDDEPPFQDEVVIIASPAVEKTTTTTVSLLSAQPDGSVATAISAALQKRGMSVDMISVRDVPKHAVISILDLEGSSSFLDGIAAGDYEHLRDFLVGTATSAEGGSILWLTRPCQVECSDPRYGAVIGLARVLRNEQKIDMATLELDEFVSEGAMDAVFGVFQRGCNSNHLVTSDGDVNPDSECAWSRGSLYIPRFHWFSASRELAERDSDCAVGIKKLEIGKRGSLQTLEWRDMPPLAPPESGEVLVETRAVGMNFKDVLIAMGIVDGNEGDASGLGVECSGVVTKLGPDVVDLHVGDRVAVIATSSYSTVLKTPADMCVKIPDNLSFEEAATMPSVFGTVIYGLLHLANLEAGQTVLIHSACGGIGIAAIQICRVVGAEVFVSVGTDEKIEYLMKTFDIPRNRIFNSRNSEFLPGILRETAGKGVDVVLNSLSGELLHASWKCVAEFGCMIELGKRDFIGQGRLAMEAFEENRSFFGVHMIPLCKRRPRLMRRVLERMMDLHRLGLISPIRPMQVFDGAKIQEAFRFMQKGRHMGKLVVRMPGDASSLLPLTTAPGAARAGLELRSDASYLLIGGLGGLGRAISTWMAERGAGNLVYLSRSAGKGAEDAALVEELAAMGCTAQLVEGSVTSLEDVRRAVKNARLPIAGVIQMSMVLRDGMFENMTHKDWTTATSPKVEGTWNLHKALHTDHSHSRDLDFFVLFSSLAGLIGQRGQANYASGNTFLDSFVQFRHGRGLAASVLDLGPVADVGYVSQNSKVMGQLRAFSNHVLRERDVLDGLELAIRRSGPGLSRWEDDGEAYVSGGQFGLGLRTTQSLSATHNNVAWKQDPRMSQYRNLAGAAGGDTPDSTSLATADDGGLKSFLAAAESDPATLGREESVLELARHIQATLGGFMIRPAEELDIRGAMAALGVDSLVAIELRNWFRRCMALDVSVLEIVQAESLEGLARVAAGRMMAKLGVEVVAGEEPVLVEG